MSCQGIASELSRMRMRTGFEKSPLATTVLGTSAQELIRCVARNLFYGVFELTAQVARIWDAQGKSTDSRYELRGHEHVIECAIFAPVSAYPYLADMSQTPKLVSTSSDAANIIPENQCRTRTICCDRFKRQNRSFVVGAGWSTVQDLGKFVLRRLC